MGVIESYGSHEAKRLPQISFLRPIGLVCRVCKKVENLTVDDFTAAGTNISDTETLLTYLKNKYPMEALPKLVTIYTVEYVGGIILKAKMEDVLNFTSDK